MSAQVVNINSRVEQQANKHMAKRFNRQAAAVKAMRLYIQARSLELFMAGVSPSVIDGIDKHLREVYADNKEMAIGGVIDELV